MSKRRSAFAGPRSLRATRAGWGFVAIIFGVGFAALNTGNNLLYLVLSLMLSFLVLSGLLSEASLRGIQVERKLPRELFAETANRVVLRVHNTQKRVAAFAILLEDWGDQPEGEDSSEAVGRTFALRIGAQQSAGRSYAYVPTRRGDFSFHTIRVSTRFPFGLFVKSRELEVEDHALIFPRIDPRQSSQNASLPDRTSAQELAGHATRGDDLAGLREFIPGDSVGRVLWRRSLRTGRLLVGEREGDASGEIEILLPLSGSPTAALFEERVVQAASEVVSALQSGFRVGLRSTSTRFSPAEGTAHRRELLTYLARVQPERAAPETLQETPAATATHAEQVHS